MALEKKYEGRVSFITVDTGDQNNQSLMEEYQLQYIPAFFIFDKQHKVAEQMVGAQKQEDLETLLDKLVK